MKTLGTAKTDEYAAAYRQRMIDKLMTMKAQVLAEEEDDE